jgi:hypothetical protein
MIDVCDGWHDRAMSGAIASEFVGDQPPGFTALAFDQATKKPFSRTLIAAVLHQNINDIAVLIHSAPEVVALSLNRNKDFVDMPGVAETSLSLFEFSGIVRAKLLAPLTNGFIGDRDATFGKQFFDLSEAEAEPMVEPHGVTDNFGGKAMTLVAGCWLFHAA